MSLKYFGILVAILAVESAVGLDPTIQIKYKKLTSKTPDNPYFKNMVTEISDSGEKGTAKFSISKTLPDTTTISVTVELEGQVVADFEDMLSELMKNEVYGKDMLKYGLPKDKFPKESPISPGDYEISKYPIPKDKFPPGMPPGDYEAKLVIGEPDLGPWVIVEAVIEISHDVPGVPVPGLGR
ncbi:uncharacterized protein LOC123267113 [Cotesia glomerata]|uniref:Uncharacterized protein n=1 Tax=Cotesia glomerata TaxID=32391 RepID=A0AAV7HSE5_COTGL|nr:uncharacterized protein LOC123267113 [Cotesia glomerata]KAH0534321.1 hypothetical protein KQX54_003061 [Cotesia glomerata]